MNVEKLALVIMGTDATSSMFAKVNKGIIDTIENFRKSETAAEKWKLTLSKGGTAMNWGAAAVGGALGVHSQVARMAHAQDGFNQVQILTGKTAEEMKAFRAKIHEIAGQTGQGFESILAVATTKMRRGMSEDDIYETLKTEGQYAVASGSKNLAQISDATHTFASKMKITHKEASGYFAGILDISKKGLMDFETLMAHANPMLSEASDLGLGRGKGLMQVMAAAQIASVDNSDPNAGAASVQAFLADMKVAKTEKSFAAFGINFEELNTAALKSGNYLDHIVKTVMEKTEGNEVALSRMFKSSASRDLIRTLSDKRKEYDEMWRGAVGADGTAVARDQEIAAKSLTFQWNKFQEQLIAVGDTTVAPILNELSKLMEFFAQNTFAAKIAIGSFATMTALGIGAKAAPIAKGVWRVGEAAVGTTQTIIDFSKKAGSLRGGIAAWSRLQFPAWLNTDLKTVTTSTKDFIKAIGAKTTAWGKVALMKGGAFFSTIGAGLKTVGIAAWGFVKALIAQAAAWAMTPFGMITIGITAIVAGAIAIWKNWDKVVAFFKNAWATLSGLWKKMPGWLQWCFPIIKITTLIVSNWSKVKDFFKNTWNWLTGLWKKMPGWLQWCFPIIKITTLIVSNWGKVKDFFKNLWPSIKTAFTNVLGVVTGFYSRFKEAGINIIKNIWSGITGMVTKPVEAIKSMAEKMRKYLPFSPAKEGPLKDIHKLRFTETIAETLNEAPLIQSLGRVMGKVKTAIPALALPLQTIAAQLPPPKKQIAQPSKQQTSSQGQVATLLRPAPSNQKQQTPQGRMTPIPKALPAIKIEINIDAKGSAPGVEKSIEAEVLKLIPKIQRALEQSAHQARRIKH